MTVEAIGLDRITQGNMTIAEANKKSEKKQRGMRLIRGERIGVGGINEE